MPNLVEIGRVILDKNNFEYCPCISAVWEKGVTLHLNQLEFPSPSLAEIEKCEKLTYGRRILQSIKYFYMFSCIPTGCLNCFIPFGT